MVENSSGSEILVEKIETILIPYWTKFSKKKDPVLRYRIWQEKECLKGRK